MPVTERAPDYTWLLNPDAEREVEHSTFVAPETYQPTLALLRAMAEKRELFLALTDKDPVRFLQEAKNTGENRPQRALLWCQTPGAVARARRAGYATGDSPSWACLQTVHNKSALHEQTLRCLPGRVTIKTLAEWNQKSPGLRSKVESFETRGQVRAKRPYGFAGRGQRTLPKDLSPDDERWLTDSLSQAPLVLEPELARPCLAAQHGVLTTSSTIFGDLMPSDLCQMPEDFQKRARDSAFDQCTRAAEFLRASGYLGPFGLDMVLSEQGLAYALDLNPRFTLGWSQGMGSKRASSIEQILSDSQL